MSLLLEYCEMGTYSIDSVPHSTKLNTDARRLTLQHLCQENAVIPEDQEINDLVLKISNFRYQVYFL